MDIRPIRTDEDYREALKEMERLWSFPDDSPENDKLDVLATLVEAYEKKRFLFRRASARGILEFVISDMGRTQAQLAELLGSRSTASELLSGKRKMTLASARKISAGWAIPIQLLVSAEEKSGRDAA